MNINNVLSASLNKIFPSFLGTISAMLGFVLHNEFGAFLTILGSILSKVVLFLHGSICTKKPFLTEIKCYLGARCSSVVRAFAHGATGRRIDPSWWTH